LGAEGGHQVDADAELGAVQPPVVAHIGQLPDALEYRPWEAAAAEKGARHRPRHVARAFGVEIGKEGVVLFGFCRLDRPRKAARHAAAAAGRR